MTYWLRVNATSLGKSPVEDPLSFHMRRKKWVARWCTLKKFKKKGWKVVDVESISTSAGRYK